MKRFLVVGLIFLMGFLCLEINGYAEEKEKAEICYSEIGGSATYTKYTKDLEEKWVFHYSLILPDSKWTRFVETRVNFYKPLEFSLSLNKIWWLYRKTDTVGPTDIKFMYGTGLFGGVGVCNVRMKEDLYARYMAHIGFKIILKRPCSVYIDGRMGRFLDEGLPYRNYASLSLGWFL